MHGMSQPWRQQEDCNSILVITNHFTKYTQAFATRNQTAHTTAKILFDEYIWHYVFHDCLQYQDRIFNFVSSVIQQLCQLTGIRQSRTTPYHIMWNGITERFNQILLYMLVCYRIRRATGKLQFQQWLMFTTALLVMQINIRHISWCFGVCQSLLLMSPIRCITVFPVPGYFADLKKNLEEAYRAVMDDVVESTDHHRTRYDLKLCGAIPHILNHVLVRNVWLKSKHKWANSWKQSVYKILDTPKEDLPVFTVKPIEGGARQWVSPRNHLFRLSFPKGSDGTMNNANATVSLPEGKAEQGEAVSQHSHVTGRYEEDDYDDGDFLGLMVLWCFLSLMLMVIIHMMFKITTMDLTVPTCHKSTVWDDWNLSLRFFTCFFFFFF